MLKYNLLSIFFTITFVYIAVTILKTFLIKYEASSNGLKNIAALSSGLVCASICTAGLRIIFTIKDILNVIKFQGTEATLDSRLIFLENQLLISCISALIFFALYLFFMKNINKELIRKLNSPKRLWDWKRVKNFL